MTRDGVWIHWVGMWFSSMILLPLGVFLTYKAMTDSVIMSTDVYAGFFRKLFFIREKRNYTIKEVVIEELNYDNIAIQSQALDDEISSHLSNYERLGYATYWNDKGYDNSLNKIKIDLENILNQLSNTRRSAIIEKAKEYPVLINYVRPFEAGSVVDKTLMYLFPVGIVVKLISLPFQKRINKDLRLIMKLNAELNEIMQFLQNK